jgi:hypothetical protein
MKKVRGTVLVISLSSSLVVPVRAEDTNLAKGTRVRLSTAGGRTIVGYLSDMNSETVIVKEPGDHPHELSFKRDEIQKLEVSQGSGHKGRGAEVGFLIGAAAGAIVGAAGTGDCSTSTLGCVSKGAAAAALGLFGGAAGAGLGAVFAHGERWQAVQPGHVAVGVVPIRHGVALSARVGF